MESRASTKSRIDIPQGFIILFERLYGSESKEAKKESMTLIEWKNTLYSILEEFEKYFNKNVDTDELHMFMIYTGFLAAKESLKEENFWPGYLEGILRITFLLMGDYPDHRRRKKGRKKEEHYNLKRFCTFQYFQDYNQKLRTLLAVPRFGLPELQMNPRKALDEFRKECGFKANYKDFFNWYKKKYGKDYALVF